MKKKLLSLLLVVMVVASCLTIGAAAITANEGVSYAISLEGKKIDVDGNGAWCVDLTKKYCNELFGWMPMGNAIDYISFNIPSGWQRIQYSSGFVPEPGDIAVFTPGVDGVSSLGHVGIIISADANGYVTLEQHVNGHEYVERKTRSYGMLWGVIRPPFDNSSPTKPDAPSASVVTINYAAETITYDGKYEVSATNFGSVIPSGGSISSYVGSISSPIYVRVKQDGSTPASDATKVTLPGRSSFVPINFVNYANETFASDSTMEYSLNGSTWTKCSGPTPISAAGSNSKIYFRYSATSTGFASSPAEVAVPTRSGAPSADVVTIDYVNETISFDSAYEVNTAADFSGSAIVSGGAIQPGSSVYVRTKATGSALASASALVSIPARPAALEVTAVDETIDGKADGQITGVSAAMEYRAASGSWTPCEGESVTGLADGTYNVRNKSTENSFAGEAATVTVGKGVPATYTLSLEIAEIETEIYNYAQPEGSALELTSSGNSKAEIVSTVVDNTDAFEIAGSGQYVEAGGSLSSYIVRPKTGLEAGDYTATVTVTYKGGESYSGSETFTVEADVAFTVEKAPQAAPKAPEVYKRELYSITLKALPTNANGAQPQYRINGGAWQSSPVFNDLKAGTSYTFEQRYAAVGSYLASEPSTAVKFSTVFPFYAETHDISISKTGNGTVKSSLPNSSSGAKVILTVTPDDGYSLGSLRVISEEGGSIAVVKEKDGRYSFTMPDHAVTVSAVFVLRSLPFTDVSAGAWYYDEVSYVYTNGLMEGVSDTLFEPNGGMTRAMVWAILARIDGVTVTGDNWAETARSWAMAEGVSDGENASAPVTREQLVTMLWRFAGEPAVDFLFTAKDADAVSGWAYEAMRWAAAEGIIEGDENGMISPADGATRAQCAAILMRYVELG